MFKYSEKSLSKLDGLHPKLIEFAHKLLEVSPHDFRIVEGVRSTETQRMYYSWGRTIFKRPTGEDIRVPVTACDGIVRKSKHQVKSDGYGYAFDIAFIGKDVNEMYDPKKFKELYKNAEPLLKKYGVVWGGVWKKYVDMPHWQMGG